MTKDLKSEKSEVHKPVLIKEVIREFGLVAPLKDQASVEDKKVIIDATLGAGGHAKEFLLNGAFVLGIDADEEMVKIAGGNLQELVKSKLACPTGNYSDFFKIVNANFSSIDVVAHEFQIQKVWGILFDLGISSYHYLFDNRGFSFQKPGSLLDMRLSQKQKVTAADLLNVLTKNNLVKLFLETMPYFEATKLSKKVMEFREIKPIHKVEDLLEIISMSHIDRAKMFNRGGHINPSTLPFLALRIAVNTELDSLSTALEKSWELLEKGGRLGVITFHSGEDRIVKNYFDHLKNNRGGSPIKRFIAPDEGEIRDNPRARSAKLRVIIKNE